MPKKRKQQRVPGSHLLPPLPSGLRVETQAAAERHYGPDVSGVIRVDDFPQQPSSYIVQLQRASADDLSGWESQAVYRSREAAEQYATRREQGGSSIGRIEARTGEYVPDRDQPLSEYRVVTLDDLMREGPLSLVRAVWSLMTSDHEWLISTEIGSDAKIALMHDFATGQVDADEGAEH